MKDIILIGNGTSVLDNKLGEIIDKHENVVRFSYYWITGYEENVGEKTDIWFTTVAQKGFRSKKQYKRIYEHSWEWNEQKDKTYIKLKKMFPETLIIKTQKQTCIDMKNYSGIQDYTVFSTGTIAAYMLSELYGLVTLYGFDWWDKSRAKHHYGDNQTLGNIHKPEYEYKILQKLKQDGRIKFLIN